MATATGLDTDYIPAPHGMQTAVSPADTANDKALYLQGFLPARRGKMRLAHLLKTFRKQVTTEAIHGHAIWYSTSGQNDWLVVFGASHVFATPLASTWTLDQRGDGPHSFYNLGAITTVATLTTTNGIISAQMLTELIVGVGGGSALSWYRFYVPADGTGTPVFHFLGVPIRDSISDGPLIVTGAVGGSMTPFSTYNYVLTFVDELGRESSPYGPFSITLGAGDHSVLIQPAVGWYAGGGSSYGLTWINFYRQNPGSTTFNYTGHKAWTAGVSIFTDTASDATVQASTQLAPTAGENDMPPSQVALGASMEVWSSRLILTSGNVIYISNAGNPQQFSSLPLPTNATDGLHFTLNRACTGLAALGDRLAIFTRNAIFLLFGSTAFDFSVRQVAQRGCINARSIQRCENDILFLSDDGLHSIGYMDGFTLDHGTNDSLSSDVSNLLDGFIPTNDPLEPTSTGLPNAAQVQDSLDIAITTFYSRRRYYLSFGNRTLVFDLSSGNWSDAGYGFIKTACHYYGQPASGTSGAPETIFLTTSDQNSWGSTLQYWTTADTPGDVDVATPILAIYRTKPLGPAGGRIVSSKRPGVFSQYGKCSAAKNSKIGTAKWYAAETQLAQTDVRLIVTKRNGALFEISPPNMNDEYVWAEFTFTDPTIELHDAVWEYSKLG